MIKVLIVIENFKIGGIQKSFINFVNGLDNQYSIEVLAFDPVGDYLGKLPIAQNILICSKETSIEEM